MLTGVIDLLATVPSIVYGFWGLVLISTLQAPPAQWLADHLGFVPIFRTPSPGQYVNSIFACGLICAVTIIPIITSISREVMAQAPRDVCEAALGLGGTRWGMVTDVILPFSRNGILGAVLLGIGRGLGETMIVVLVLSQGNHLTPRASWGRTAWDRLRQQITDNFDLASPIYKSGLILARSGPVRDDPGHQRRWPGSSSQRSGGGPCDADRSRAPGTPPRTARPVRWSRAPTGRGPDAVDLAGAVVEMGGSALAAWPLVWVAFSVAGIVGPLGFVSLLAGGLLHHLRIMCWQRYGVLAMKDRLATLGIWVGAACARSSHWSA